MSIAILLAGGKSRRLGRNKIWLPFPEEPMAVALSRRLATAFDTVVFATTPGAEVPEVSARVVEDIYPGRGPLAGIHAGLLAVSEPRAFVTACDTPFVSLPLARHLLEISPEYDLVVPRWNGRFEPLVAVYSRALLPEIERRLQTQDLKIRGLFDAAKVYILEQEEIEPFDHQGLSFFNINSDEDYAQALEIVSRGEHEASEGFQGGH